MKTLELRKEILAGKRIIKTEINERFAQEAFYTDVIEETWLSVDLGEAYEKDVNFMVCGDIYDFPEYEGKQVNIALEVIKPEEVIEIMADFVKENKEELILNGHSKLVISLTDFRKGNLRLKKEFDLIRE